MNVDKWDRDKALQLGNKLYDPATTSLVQKFRHKAWRDILYCVKRLHEDDHGAEHYLPAIVEVLKEAVEARDAVSARKQRQLIADHFDFEETPEQKARREEREALWAAALKVATDLRPEYLREDRKNIETRVVRTYDGKKWQAEYLDRNGDFRWFTPLCDTREEAEAMVPRWRNVRMSGHEASSATVERVGGFPAR